MNDKILTVLTGLILFAGVGIVVHKGDELFGAKVATTQVAKAGIKTTTQSDITPEQYWYDSIQTENITQISPPDQVDFSEFKLVRSDQAVFASTLYETTNPLKINLMPFDCALNLTAKSLRGARVQLDISAPCHKSKVVTITHAGLRFNEILNEKGKITIIIPVLSNPANIEVSFADGISKSISTPAKDLSSLQRTGVAWSTGVDLELYVQESAYNAAYNNEITAINPRSYQTSYLHGGGYMTTLGNRAVAGGQFIQIYSVENPNNIFVDFKVILKNPESRCGVGFSIKTVHYNPDFGTQLSNKNVSVKNCSAENKTIVLKNMLRNLIVAQRN